MQGNENEQKEEFCVIWALVGIVYLAVVIFILSLMSAARAGDEHAERLFQQGDITGHPEKQD